MPENTLAPEVVERLKELLGKYGHRESGGGSTLVVTTLKFLPALLAAAEERNRLKEQVERYEAMKEGVAIRIADLESERDRLRAKLLAVDRCYHGQGDVFAVTKGIADDFPEAQS